MSVRKVQVPVWARQGVGRRRGGEGGEGGEGRAPPQLPLLVTRYTTGSSSLDPGAGRLPLGPPRDRLCCVLHGAAHPSCYLRGLLEVGGTPGRLGQEVAGHPGLRGAS